MTYAQRFKSVALNQQWMLCISAKKSSNSEHYIDKTCAGFTSTGTEQSQDGQGGYLSWK